MNRQQVVLVVTLRRDEARVADEPADRGLVEAVDRAGGAHDVLLHHYRAHVAGPVVQRGLADVGHPTNYQLP